MEVWDVLLVGIEASIALAGFAGIIATYQSKDIAGVRRGPVGSLAVIVQFSLMASLACSVPILLHTFGMADRTLWAISSAVAAALTIGGAYGIAKRMEGSLAKPSVRLMFRSLQIVGALVALAMILNAADTIFHREPGPLILGLIYTLSVAAYMFSRLLLIPLWRVVREQEAENSNS